MGNSVFRMRFSKTRPFDRLDLGMMITIVALVVGIGLTLLGGDRAGVGVLAFGPVDGAHTTEPITMQFSEAMDTASVEAGFSIDPPSEGRFMRSGTRLTFTPRRAWVPGTLYTVTLRAGIASNTGRRLISDITWTFRAAAPKIAYLAPALASDAAAPVNIWIADPAKPLEPIQLTRSGNGVGDDFRPSPDGRYIAYTQPGERGTSDIFVIEVATRQARRITNCPPVQARCLSPDWSPDGARLVYERIELDPALDASERDKPRAWIVNLRDLSTAPLLGSSIYLGSVPKWSPDGGRIAVYDPNLSAIAIYNLTTGDQQVIPTLEGASGEFAFEPGGSRFVYPKLTILPQRFSSELELVDLDNPTSGIKALSGEAKSVVEDKLPAWRPGSDELTFTRRYLDASGPLDAQIYTVDLTTGEIRPLVVDERYFHGAISWDAPGNWLLMQRRPPDGPPGIWVYEAGTGKIWQVAENGYFPRWLP